MVTDATLDAIKGMGYLAYRPDLSIERVCHWRSDCPERRAFVAGWEMKERNDDMLFPDLPDEDEETSWF